MNRLKPEKQARMLHDLLECGSLRSVERKHRTSFNTGLRLLENAGDMAIDHITSLSKLECARIQIDEFYTYIGTKKSDLSGPDAEGRGKAWVYLAIDADTKFIVDFHIGTQGVHDATHMLKSLASKLHGKENGEFAVLRSLPMV